MHTTWRLASCDSTTDVKEMLPEFFFLPEFLVNSQGTLATGNLGIAVSKLSFIIPGFNFGVRQNGAIVDDVELPPWAKGDARRFILIHRQALESDYVTENLPHWIDLVFGYKQTGKAAVDAINVFHPAVSNLFAFLILKPALFLFFINCRNHENKRMEAAIFYQQHNFT